MVLHAFRDDGKSFVERQQPHEPHALVSE